MRESIGGAGVFQIVIVLLLLFTAYFCLSINYTSAYKVTDSINNQIIRDEGVNPTNISQALSEAHYTSSGKCNQGDDDQWTGFLLDGSQLYNVDANANYCLKKIKVANSGDENMPDVVYYRIKVFFNIDVPIISSFNFNVKADSKNIYAPKEEGNYVKIPEVKLESEEEI